MSEHATELQTPSRNSALKISGKILAGCATLLSIVGGILAIYVFVIESRSKPLVNLSVLYSQCLTQVVSVPNLGSHFSFRGREVRNLWVSKIQFANECRRNIIGLPGRDLMYSNLFVTVTNGFDVISAELECSDFDVNIASTNNEIALSFEKWKPNQVCSIKVYSESTFVGVDVLPPKFISVKDPFTQGELRIVDYKESVKPISLLRLFPYWAYTFMTWIGLIGFGGVFISLWCWFIMSWFTFARSLRWNRKYRAAVILAIKSQSYANEGGGRIKAMDDDFWRNSNIPKPPPSSDFLTRGKIDWGEILVTNGFIFIMIMLMFIALSALIYI